jgi:hypothetical protein
MPGIPQITTPITGKGFSSGTLNEKQSSGAGEPFDIIQLTRPDTVESVVLRSAGTDDKAAAKESKQDFLPLSVRTPKDPTMAVESLKQLISADLMAVAKSGGYTELYGDIEDLMKSLFLKTEDLLPEILTQEKQTTMFTGDKLFDLLRQVAFTAEKTSNIEMQGAIGQFLKSLNFLKGRDEILNALSSNLRFLSHYFRANKNMAADLKLLSEQWGGADAPKYFTLLKNETLSLLKNVSESLLNSERTQTLIPLIIHNISRYNTNAAMVTDTFSTLMTFVAGQQTRSQLTEAFDAFIQQFLPSANGNATNANTPRNPATAANMPNNPAATANMPHNPAAAAQNAVNAAGNPPGQNPNGAVTQGQSNPPDAAPLQQNGQPGSTVAAPAQNTPAQGAPVNLPQTAAYVGEVLTDVAFLRAALAQPQDQLMFGEFLPQSALDSSAGENPAAQAQSAQNQTVQIPAALMQTLQTKLSGIAVAYENGWLQQGTAALGAVLDQLITDPDMKYLSVSDSDDLATLEAVKSYMNVIIANLPNNQAGFALRDTFEFILRQMINNGELPSGNQPADSDNGGKTDYDPSILYNQNGEGDTAARQGKGGEERTHSTLDQLVAFVERNIDHAALKTINNYNASNLLQSLINAPGVFTPLAHYIIPLQIDDTRAFGELWVDNDEEGDKTGGSSGSKGYHLFLTFEVDGVGRFEIDLAASEENVSMALYHPASFAEKVPDIVSSVNRVVAQLGYRTKNFTTGTLIKPRNLTQVFPDITEKRKGFNVKV